MKHRVRILLIALFCLAVSTGARAEVKDLSVLESHLPVVSAPGLGMTGAMYRDYSPLVALFKARGYDLRIADTNQYGTIEEREASFVKSVKVLVPNGQFHIVAHSMGGLDARLALAKHEFGSRVVSLTTLSTPHRGTPASVYLIDYLRRKNQKINPDLMAALNELTPEHMALFNAAVPNDPLVKYFSLEFYIPSGPLFFYTLNPLIWIGHSAIDKAGEGRNDGFVSERSATWGQSIGALPGDHFTEVLNVPFNGRFLVKKNVETVLKNLDIISKQIK